ncbi:MAG: hypothetical protein GX620_05065 [Chloroflexi bacterium]|nr:hypothetical protein [Chloroflexota bacterium]
MRRNQLSALLGVLLILVGALFLLEAFGIIVVSNLIWPVLFGLGGLVFLYVFAQNHDNWWALIPGFTLLGLTGVILWSELAPAPLQGWAGSFFLGGIAASFWAIYLHRREHWWAIIPAGVLTTLALVVGLASVLQRVIDTGSVLFLGFAITFGLLSLVRTPEGRLTWALIPAAVFLTLAVIIGAAMTTIWSIVWPVALIVAGIILILRVIVTHR